MLKNIEQERKENYIFFYTNLREEDAIIEPSQINILYSIIKDLEKKYDTVNIIINTNGGNLRLFKGKRANPAKTLVQDDLRRGIDAQRPVCQFHHTAGDNDCL